MDHRPLTIAVLNDLDQSAFVARLGHLYEGSPWVAADTWPHRPFASLSDLHQQLTRTVADAGRPRHLDLIRAHPGLVPVAQEIFDRVLGDRPNQKDRPRDDVTIAGPELIDFTIPGATITEAGLRNNVSVALQYLNAWLQGTGAAAIFNLMEDAATAEISRAQIWQWIRAGATTDDGTPITRQRFAAIRDEELAKLGGPDEGRYREAADILDQLVESDDFVPFLTLPAYQRLA